MRFIVWSTTALFIGLRLAGKIDWPWGFVLLPLLLWEGSALLAYASVALFGGVSGVVVVGRTLVLVGAAAAFWFLGPGLFVLAVGALLCLMDTKH